MKKGVILIYLLLWILPKVGIAQTASIAISLNKQCKPLSATTISGSVAGGALAWNWFENGAALPAYTNQQSFTKTYTADGTYIIKLNVTLTNGTVVTAVDTVTVYPEPIANFVMADLGDTIGCMPHTVEFNSTSTTKTGAITKYSWNFGTAPITNTDTNPSPSFTYTTPGSYEVSLIVTNNWGCFSKTLPKKIITVSAQPKADFTIQNNVSCDTSLNAVFKNTTQTTVPLIYKWDFGDNTATDDTLVVTTKNPPVSYLYKHPGNYTITLTVKSVNGTCKSTYKTPYAKSIFIGTPKAYITSKDSICAGKYTHTGGSTPVATYYKWLFDGVNYGSNPESDFTTTGLHHIMFIATNYGGCADTVQKDVFVIKSPKISFVPDQAIGCKVPFNVTFTPTSDTPGLKYLWNFGDGGTSTVKVPTHSYTIASWYAVNLKVTDTLTSCGTDAAIFYYIKIGVPKIDFEFSPPGGCGVVTITAKATVTGLIAPIVPAKYIWDFGDGSGKDTTTTPVASHTYTTPGTFGISVTIVTAEGCTATSEIKNMSVSPEPCDDDGGGTGGGGGGGFMFGKSCGDKYTITFTDTLKNSKTLSFIFGDGDTLKPVINNTCTHAYTKPPTKPYSFDVTIIRKDTVTNITSSAKKRIIIIDEKADFGSILFNCSNVKFFTKGIDSSKVQKFYWDFGDSTNLTIKNDLTKNGPYKGNDTIPHHYSKSGKYKVRLLITDKLGCMDSTFFEIEIKTPIAYIAVTPSKICGDSMLVILKDSSLQSNTAAITSWIWEYGDGGKRDTIKVADTVLKHMYYINSLVYKSYTATLKIIDAIGCESQAEKIIKLYKPKAAFSSVDTLVCKDKKKYISLANYSSAYNGSCTWDYGDGTAPQNCTYMCWGSHQYQAVNFYQIKLVVKDENNCKDSIVRKDYIKVVQPKADFVFNKEDTCRCAPVSIAFRDSSKYADTWHWYFDNTDGGTSANTQQGFDAGYYNIKLIVTGLDGCVDTTVKKLHIKGPIGKLKISDNAGCAPFSTSMSIVGNQNVESYAWDLGTTVIGTQIPTINYTYTTPGKYLPNVVLTSPKPCMNSLNGCTASLVPPDSIVVDSIKADFLIEKLEVCNVGKIKLFNKSWLPYFSELKSIKWTMGDGTVINDSLVVSHVYTAPGSYTITLDVASKYGCSSTLTKVVEIGESPKIKIKGIDTVCLSANSVLHYEAVVESFTSVFDSIQTYKWKIDGVAVGGNQKEISYNLRTPGLHSIQLCAITKHGCDSCVTKQIVIDSVKANFTAMDTTSFCGMGTVIYTNTSIASSPLTYWWIFDSIKTSTNTNETVFYPHAGTYSVTLISKTKYGCTDTAKYIDLVKIYPTVTASILGEALHCRPSVVTYTDSSSTKDSIGSYVWYLDNNFMHAGKVFSHAINAGTHQLKLIVTTIHNCVDTVTKDLKIDSLSANFSVLNPVNCGDSAIVKFKNHSYAKFGVDSTFWDFGNMKLALDDVDTISNLYIKKPLDQPDKYDIGLVLKSTTGCLDTFYRPAAVKVISNPVLSITGAPLVCSPRVVPFKELITTYDTVDSRAWYVNGIKVDSSKNFKTFFNAGVYDIALKIKTRNGCKGGTVATLTVDSLKANFATGKEVLCGNSDTVKFFNASYGLQGITNYYWDFGDTDTASVKDPYHIYQIAGLKNTYDVSLIIKSTTGCKDTLAKIATLQHYNYTRTTLKSSLQRCIGDAILIEAIPTLQDAIISYKWYVDSVFMADSSKNIIHTFQTSGVHTIQLKVNTEHNCTLPLDTSIIVNPNPIPSVTADTVICLGQTLQLQVHDGVAYTWTPPLYLSNDTASNPIASPTKSIVYGVEVVNKFGCKATDSVKITVDKPLVLNVDEEPLICAGKSVQLHAYAATKKFLWSPSIGLDNVNIANPFASPTITTTYKVVAYSTNSCPDESAFTTVMIGQIPELHVTADTSVLSGTTLQLFAEVGNLIPVSYLWEPSKGLSCSDCPAPFVTLNKNKVYTVTVNTAENCPAKHTVNLDVFCVEGLFIPNSFTPNHDDLNEVFYLKGRNNSIVESMTIYNRWGSQVFKQEHFPLNDPAYGWDGRVNGTPTDVSDVYVYEVKIRCENGYIYVIKDIVTLVL